MLTYLLGGEHWIASEMLHEIRRWDVRRKIVLRYTQKILGVAAEEKAASHLDLDALRELGSLRDRLAHGVFIVPQSLPDTVLLKEGYGDGEQHFPFTVVLLDELLEIYFQHGSRVSELWMQYVSYNSQKMFAAEVERNPKILTDLENMIRRANSLVAQAQPSEPEK
ncbi:MAG: hypothetical protein SFV19_20485 [Rhodospirillaceae bacterium]|nr:hypothetical protein [Rhodospirillaceae bacterium]